MYWTRRSAHLHRQQTDAHISLTNTHNQITRPSNISSFRPYPALRPNLFTTSLPPFGERTLTPILQFWSHTLRKLHWLMKALCNKAGYIPLNWKACKIWLNINLQTLLGNLISLYEYRYWYATWSINFFSFHSVLTNSPPLCVSFFQISIRVYNHFHSQLIPRPSLKSLCLLPLSNQKQSICRQLLVLSFYFATITAAIIASRQCKLIHGDPQSTVFVTQSKNKTAIINDVSMINWLSVRAYVFATLCGRLSFFSSRVTQAAWL